VLLHLLVPGVSLIYQVTTNTIISDHTPSAGSYLNQGQVDIACAFG
jgi:hypothetical protein